MQLPIVFQPQISSLPPMYAWPRPIKQVLLAVSVLVVIAAYIILAGGIIAALAVLAQMMGGV